MGKHIDLSGNQYGRLVVNRYLGRSKWLCECSCGNTAIVSTKYLKTGKEQSCGCTKPKKYVDLAGERYGRLVASEYVGASKWLCVCDCGNSIVVRASSLKAGYTKSCGCIGGHTTHGLSHTKLYEVWCNMKSRCYSKSNPQYRYYGARGISVCDEWRNDFKAFYDWAMSNGYNPDAKGHELTIDRIDGNLGYFPDNCRWADASTQAYNRRKYEAPKAWRPVEMVDNLGNVLAYYPSVKAASEATGYKIGNISNVCRGTQQTTHGKRFRFANTCDKAKD